MDLQPLHDFMPEMMSGFGFSRNRESLQQLLFDATATGYRSAGPSNLNRGIIWAVYKGTNSKDRCV